MIAPYNDIYLKGTVLSGNLLPPAPITILLFLIFLNAALRKAKFGTPLSSRELAVIWIMMMAATNIPYSGLLGILLPFFIAPFYFATPENEWAELFHRYIPSGLVVRDTKAVEYYYEGLPSGMDIPWAAWTKPIIIWTTVVFILYFMVLCLCTVLREQWVEREKFAFPHVQLIASEIEQPDNNSLLNPFFKNKMMWIGFSIPVILHLFNGFHFYFPSVPMIPMKFDTSALFTEKPLKAVGNLPFQVIPGIIGVSYLINMEVAFSLWFFLLLDRVSYVFASAMGIEMWNREAAVQQEMGGYLVLSVFILWASREQIKGILRKAFSTVGRKPSVTSRSYADDSFVSPRTRRNENELLPYHWAITGLSGGSILLALLCTWGGMSFLIALVAILLFLSITAIMIWMVANAGLLSTQSSFRIGEYLTICLGSRFLGPKNLTVLAFQTGLAGWKEYYPPSVMNGLKLSDSVKLNRRGLTGAIMLALVVAIAVTYYSSLKLTYHHGAANMALWAHMGYVNVPFTKLQSYLVNPTTTDKLGVSFLSFGGITMLFLIFMRRRFLWWSIHPIGYIMRTTWVATYSWGSFLIGWLLKRTILKYGGIKIYRNARPFFLGMILGESVIGILWIIVGLITKRGYTVPY